MLVLIFGLTYLILIATTYANARRVSKEGRLLGATLSPARWDDGEVQAILCRYRRQTDLLFLLTALAAAPFFLLERWPSLLLLQMALVYGCCLFLASRLRVGAFQSLLALKRRRGWCLGAPLTLPVDLRTVAARRELPLSPLWFLPALGLCAGLLLLLPLARPAMRPAATLLAALHLATCLFCLWRAGRGAGRVRTYCADSEVNLRCNRRVYRLWSAFWAITALGEGVFFLLLFFALFTPQPPSFPLGAFFHLFALAGAGGALFFQARLEQVQQAATTEVKTPFLADDDEYWAAGYYCNPRDPRDRAEERDPFLSPYNRAHPRGRWKARAPYLVLALVLLPVLGLHFTPLRLQIDGAQVRIAAPAFGYRFDAAELESVALVKEIEGSAVRAGGGSTSEYDMGNYSSTVYGPCKFYIYKKNPPFIQMVVDGKAVFLNGRTQEETMSYYRALEALTDG